MAKEVRKTLRFSEAEWEKIESKISEHNLNFSDFARSAILKKKVKTKLTHDLIFQLQKIGNNLNQIAKKLNQNSDVPNSEVLRKMVDIQNEIRTISDDH